MEAAAAAAERERRRGVLHPLGTGQRRQRWPARMVPARPDRCGEGSGWAVSRVEPADRASASRSQRPQSRSVGGHPPAGSVTHTSWSRQRRPNAQYAIELPGLARMTIRQPLLLPRISLSDRWLKSRHARTADATSTTTSVTVNDRLKSGFMFSPRRRGLGRRLRLSGKCESGDQERFHLSVLRRSVGRRP